MELISLKVDFGWVVVVASVKPIKTHLELGLEYAPIELLWITCSSIVKWPKGFGGTP